MKWANKWKRKFTCDECKTAFFAGTREWSRAGRLRCVGCGSARLTMSGAGQDAVAEFQAERADVSARCDKGGSGSVIPGS